MHSPADLHWLTKNIQFPTLKHLILRSPIISSGPTDHFSSLPYFTPLLIALSRTSAPHSVHLSVHLRFQALPMLVRGDPDIQWPDITFLSGFSAFRHPIELHVSLARVGHLFEESSDATRWKISHVR